MKYFLQSPSGRQISMFLSLTVIAVSTFFLSGYAIGNPAFYTWPSNAVPVALPTSILFLILSIAVFLITARKIEERVEETDEKSSVNTKRLDKIEKIILDMDGKKIESVAWLRIRDTLKGIHMIQNLFKNWKTSSVGLTMIIGAVIHLVFAVKNRLADENTWTASVLAIVTGVGFIAAGDAAVSAQSHADSTAAISDLTSKVNTTAAAVVSGDTTLITRDAKAATVTPVFPPTPPTPKV